MTASVWSWCRCTGGNQRNKNLGSCIYMSLGYMLLEIFHTLSQVLSLLIYRRISTMHKELTRQYANFPPSLLLQTIRRRYSNRAKLGPEQGPLPAPLGRVNFSENKLFLSNFVG